MLVVYLLINEPKLVVDLVYLSALFMIARSIDYAFPYLRRLLFFKNQTLSSEVIFASQLIQVVTVVCLSLIIGQGVGSALAMGMAVVLFSRNLLVSNVCQRSYFNNLAHPLATLVTASGIYLYQAPVELYLYTTITYFLLLEFLNSKPWRDHDFLDLKIAYDRNVLANFAMILVHIAFTQLGIVVFYNMIPESEFVDFNIVKRFENIVIGLAGVVGTALWNQNGSKITRLDRLTTNHVIYTLSSLVLVLASLLTFFAPADVTVDRAFMICYSIIIPMSIYTYFVSQILFRVAQSEKLFLFTIFEGAVSAIVLFVFLDVYIYIYALVLLVLVKAFFFHSLFRHANSSN